MKSKLLIALFPILVAGCAGQDMTEPDVHPKGSASVSCANKALESAMNEAEKLKIEIYGESTRSNAKFASIEPVVMMSTRSSENDTIYIVNYGDDEGFSVVTTAPGLESVHAVSNQGSLHISDTINNKGLAAFFSNLNYELNANSAIARPTLPDSTLQPEMPLVRNYRISHKQPMLTPVVRSWHQDYPFNMYCPKIGGENTKVGCLALSTSQILSYFEYPKIVGGMAIDWAVVKSENTNMTYNLLRIIGSKQYWNLSYGLNISNNFEFDPYTGENNVIKTFQKLGYTLDNRKRFSDSHPMLDMDKGPLFVISLTENDYYAGRHAWVMDGYHSVYYETKVVGDSDPLGREWLPHSYVLYHCLWGEKQKQDGYYRWNSEKGYIGGDKPDLTDKDDRPGEGVKLYGVYYYSNFVKSN